MRHGRGGGGAWGCHPQLDCFRTALVREIDAAVARLVLELYGGNTGDLAVTAVIVVVARA